MPPPLLGSRLQLWLWEVMTSVSVRQDVGGAQPDVLSHCAAVGPTVAAMFGVVLAVVCHIMLIMVAVQVACGGTRLD